MERLQRFQRLALFLGTWMDGTRKPTLSPSNQLIVQTRRAVFGTFLLLDAPALAFAAALLHLRYAPLLLYEPADVVTSALLPVVTTAIDGLWVAALWLLDLYYPVTFLSKPVGELASLVILTVLHLTTGLYLYVDLSYTPFSPKLSGSNFVQQRSFSITALMLVLFLLLQAITLAFSLLVVLYSTICYLRAGRWDALDHPICRYDPKAVLFHRHPLKFLQHNSSTLNTFSSPNSRSTSRAALIRNTSGEPNHNTRDGFISDHHPREGRIVGGASVTGPRGQPGWGASETTSISITNVV